MGPHLEKLVLDNVFLIFSGCKKPVAARFPFFRGGKREKALSQRGHEPVKTPSSGEIFTAFFF